MDVRPPLDLMLDAVGVVEKDLDIASSIAIVS